MFLLAGLTIANAQDKDIRPAAIGVSLIQNDYLSADRILSTSLANVLANKKMAKFSEMDKGLAFHYFKGLHKYVDLDAALYGIKTKDYKGIGQYPDKKLLIGTQVAANIKLLSENYWVQPYMIAGVGAHMFNFNSFGADLTPGLGIKVNFFDKVHFFMSGQYHVPVTPNTSAYHFNRQIGLAFRIGQKAEKAVVIAPPPPPEPKPVPIVEEVKDRDGDGIPDAEDRCPDAPGSVALFGCPDQDGDGIADIDDKCPTLPGPASNQGCPEVKEEVKKVIDEAAKSIYFVTNGDQLEKRSFPALNLILAELKKDKDLKADIEGHTDNVGADAYNQGLSERRAAVVADWFVENGIDRSRLQSAGFGETRPVAENTTAKGRQLNRRTEMKLRYD